MSRGRRKKVKNDAFTLTNADLNFSNDSSDSIEIKKDKTITSNLLMRDWKMICSVLAFAGNSELVLDMTKDEEYAAHELALKIAKMQGISNFSFVMMPFEDERNLKKYATNKEQLLQLKSFIKFGEEKV